MWPASVNGQQVTGQEVRVSIKAAVSWLRDQQRADGEWADYPRFEGGVTALVTLALLNAGVSPEEDWIKSALNNIRDYPLKRTYVVGLKIQSLAAADADRYRDQIQAGADWLIRAQHKNGMWGYDLKSVHTDFSNSQYALMGLHDAARAGIKIPDEVWRKAERSWIKAQLSDGGWGYVPNVRRSTGSMTTAGVSSLYITGNSLMTGKEKGFTEEGEAPHCGRYSAYRPLARGLAWLGENFSARHNPGSDTWYYYYLYGVERVGIMSGLRYFGKHDWYRAAAARLVRTQHPLGYWEENNAVVDTSFALLFLAKGYKPVLFNKLQWSKGNKWNLDRNDVAHLVDFIGDRLGGPMGWEVVSLESDVENWLTAPILYFNGHEFPQFDKGQVSKLVDYVNQGGNILAEACCGQQDFRDGFRTFIKQTFPDYELIRLPVEHPVFEMIFKLDGSQTELYGVAAGCRTSVIFSPHDLSCLWEQGNIPIKSRQAFELGTNIAAYLTGLEPLPDKLDAARIIAKSKLRMESVTPPRGAVYIAQLMHNGDWRPDPKAILNLAEYLHEKMGVDVIHAYKPLRATDPMLAHHPIVFMTGHYTFELSPQEIEALGRHVKRGGFLFADACCGRKPFDTAFRELANKLFPDKTLERLPASHPIIAGKPGIALDKVEYKPAVKAEQPDLKAVWLEGITIEGRTAVVYSPYGIGCGLDGHVCVACRGIVPDDAKKLAANIILYALSY
ncbi:MAG: DUF4159 domain-containing protein [Planctomycetota bacterium]|nr:MAG: DUF4159 domain-containing protein [Planctomycetota bacterium]